MIYILGVDHLIQYNNGIVPLNIFMEFKDYLVKNAPALNISLIAEEFSREALYEVYGASASTVKKAAGEINIEHRFCDPEEGDRIRLGIPYFADIRERVKEKYEIKEKFILDSGLRKRIDSECADISKEYWGLREEFWFDKISDRISDNIIFICGHEHAERFATLLARKGISCVILDAFWGKETFEDYDKLFSRTDIDAAAKNE